MEHFFSPEVKWELLICGLLTIIFLLFARKIKNAKPLNWLPSLWTSAGVFGTFYTIYFGLLNLPVDISLPELVQKVVPAFSTSLVGILGAMIISCVLKLWNSWSEKKEEDNYKNLTRKASPEEVLYEIEEYIVSSIQKSDNRNIKNNEIFKEFDDVLKSKLDDVLIALSTIISHENTFHKEINQVFVSALENQSESFGNQISDQNQKFSEMLNSVSTLINDNVQLLNNTQKDAIAEIIQQANENAKKNYAILAEESSNRNEELGKSLENLHTEINESINALKASFKEYVDMQNSKMQETHTLISTNISDYTKRMEDLFVHDVKDIINKFAEKQVEESRIILETTHEEMLSVAEKFLNKQTDLSEAAMNRMSEHLENTSEKLSDSVELMKEDIALSLNNMQNQQIDAINKAMEKTVADTKDICDAYKANVSHVAEWLKSNHDEWINSIVENRQKFEERIELTESNHFAKTEEVFASAATQLSTLLNNINEIGRKFEVATNEMKSAIETLNAQTVADTKSICDTYQTNLTAVSNTMKSDYEVWEEMIIEQRENFAKALVETENHHLEQTNKIYSIAQSQLNELSSSINTIGLSINKSAEEIQTNFTDLFAKSVSDTKTIVDGYNASLTSISCAMKSDYEKWGKLIIEQCESFSKDLCVNEDKHVEATKTLLKTSEEKLDELLSSINSLACNFNQTALKIQEALIEFGVRSVDDTKSVCDAYQANLAHITENMDNNYSGFISKIEENQNALGNKLVETESRHLTQSQDIYKETEDKLEVLLASINNICLSLNNATQNIQSSLVNFAAQTVDDTKTICNAYTANVNSVSQTIKDDYQNISRGIIENGNKLMDKSYDAQKLFMSKLNELSASMVEICEMFAKVPDELVKRSEELAGEMAQTHVENMKQITNDFNQNNNMLLSSMKLQRDQFEQELSSEGKRQMDTMRSIYVTATNRMSGLFASFTDNISNSMKIEEFEEACNRLIDEVKNCTNELKTQVSKANAKTRKEGKIEKVQKNESVQNAQEIKD